MSVSLQEISGPSAKGSEETQLVIFVLAGCEAAVGIRQVREIIRVSEITMMPKAPPFLEGIINLRGRIIPVLDLKKRFQMPLIDRTDETRILVVEINDQMIGFLVDKVVEALKISLSLVESVKEPVLGVGPEFIEGSISLGRRLILLLRLKSLLTFEETKALTE